jgi:hypothetical protein
MYGSHWTTSYTLHIIPSPTFPLILHATGSLETLRVINASRNVVRWGNARLTLVHAPSSCRSCQRGMAANCHALGGGEFRWQRSTRAWHRGRSCPVRGLQAGPQPDRLRECLRHGFEDCCSEGSRRTPTSAPGSDEVGILPDHLALGSWPQGGRSTAPLHDGCQPKRPIHDVLEILLMQGGA